MTDGTSEFINVVFDPNFQSFDSELACMTLDKMMSIQYSEEVLQKNFSVMISILKQLHRGQSDLSLGQKDNKDWIQKLREITTTNGFQERLDSLDQKLDSNLQALKQELDDIKSKLQDQDGRNQKNDQIKNRDNSETDNNQNLPQNILDEINQLRAQIQNCITQPDLEKQLDGKLLDVNSTLQRNQEQIDKINDYIQTLHNQTINQNSEVQIATGTSGQLFTNNLEEQIKNILDEINKLKNQSTNQDLESQLDEIKRKVQLHDDKLQTINETVATNVEDIEILKKATRALRDQQKTLQSQTDLLETTVSLVGAGQSSVDQGENKDQDTGIRQNQMSLILGEINKLRIQLDKYVTSQDFDICQDKVNQKFKSINDHLTEQFETIKKDNNVRFDLKMNISDALKIVNEVNSLKEQIAILQAQLSLAGQHQQQTSQIMVQDPQLAMNMKDLQDQLNSLQNEVKNHRLAYNQYVGVNNTRISEIEKKLQGLQLDRVLSELQQLRETTESVKKDTDSNTKKLKEIRKVIDAFISKEEVHIYVNDKITILREELLSIIKVFEEITSKKGDSKDLAKVEQNMLSKLEEVVQALIKQLANKQETKKALIYLEQKIIAQSYTITSQDGDGLFTKKPLLWSCASCDKDLDKFKGNLGDYRGWAVFPPKETSPERMGRFGVGYKNMQEKVRVNRDKLEKERDLYDQQSTNAQRPGTQTQGGFYNSQVHFGSSANAGEHLPKINQGQNQK